MMIVRFRGTDGVVAHAGLGLALRMNRTVPSMNRAFIPPGWAAPYPWLPWLQLVLAVRSGWTPPLPVFERVELSQLPLPPKSQPQLYPWLSTTSLPVLSNLRQ